MSQRELLVTALSEAAEIEHAITCQYLFAAFSLKTHPEEGAPAPSSLSECEGGRPSSSASHARRWPTTPW